MRPHMLTAPLTINEMRHFFWWQKVYTRLLLLSFVHIIISIPPSLHQETGFLLHLIHVVHISLLCRCPFLIIFQIHHANCKIEFTYICNVHRHIHQFTTSVLLQMFSFILLSSFFFSSGWVPHTFWNFVFPLPCCVDGFSGAHKAVSFWIKISGSWKQFGVLLYYIKLHPFLRTGSYVSPCECQVIIHILLMYFCISMIYFILKY